MFMIHCSFGRWKAGFSDVLKQQVHTQNIANVDTPDYKLREFSFGNALDGAIERRLENGNKEYAFEAKVTEQDQTEVLIDGNNVNLDSEGLELYSAYLQQAGIIQKMNSVFSDYNYVLSNTNFK